MPRRTPAPGVITALTFQKNSSDWVNLYLDGEFALAVPALEAGRLRVGQTLSQEDLERLEGMAAHARAYERALKFLSYRPRSLAETRRYLAGKGVEPAHMEAVIQRLQELGYLDDRAFARWWVENRQQFRPRGAFVLRQELRQRGVAEHIIEEVLGAVVPVERETVEGLARRRAARLRGEDRAGFYRKLSAFLLRRGFAGEEVSAIVAQLWRELQEEKQEAPDTMQTSQHLDIP